MQRSVTPDGRLFLFDFFRNLWTVSWVRMGLQSDSVSLFAAHRPEKRKIRLFSK